MEIFRVIYGEKTGALACLVHSLIIYVKYIPLDFIEIRALISL